MKNLSCFFNGAQKISKAHNNIEDFSFFFYIPL